MKIYRIKSNIKRTKQPCNPEGYVNSIHNNGQTVITTKNGKFWYSKTLVEKSLKWCNKRQEELCFEPYTIEVCKLVICS